MYDAYHMGMVGLDIVAELERHLPVIGHIQIAAVPTRAEPDQGDIPLAPFLQALDDLGYGGWVGCEYKPGGDTDAGLAWVEAMGLSLSR